MKNLADDLVVTCDKIVDIPDMVSINPNKLLTYCCCSIHNSCLILVVAIVIK